MPKPPLGKVAVGDQLIVIPTRLGASQPRPIDVTVTKVGRIWVELEEIYNVPSMKQHWRLRLDTQDVGIIPGVGDRFVTPEQLAWEQDQTETPA